ncbi:CpXC domain-containing protein [Hutsoniella sourekii]|uniref:CpXC domain-containing protein n=1 Tax=Hutsoniella sourekii TaxID=87650 RepID=UPI0004B389BD|nr:CpXC domain-containing protein [Hutsoniella sourekii]
MQELISIQCPVCDHEQMFTRYTSINSHLEPELKNKLIRGQLFLFECEVCGASRHIESTFLYHDPDARWMIYLAPHYASQVEETDQQLSNILTSLDFSWDEYQLRVVGSITSLIEKIQIYQNGYDDQLIEIVKLLTDGLFAKEKPDCQVYGRYYYKDNKDEKIIYLTNQGQLLVDFHESLVHFVQDKYGKLLKTPHLGHFIHVDDQWAENLLEGLPGDYQAPTEEETDQI